MKSFFGAIAGVIVVNGLIICLAVLFVLMKVDATPKIQKGSVLVEELDGSIPEYLPPTTPLEFGDPPPTQTSILENLEKAEHDERIAAVVLKVGYPGMGWAKMNEIRERIERIRAAGKPIYAYAQTLTNRGLYIASACDSVYLLPGGYVSLHGFASERSFLGGTLKKLGIRENLHKIGAYKSAAEMLQRSDLSDAARKNVEWILDSVYPSFVETVETGRGMPLGTLEPTVLSKGALTVHETLAAGLVDRLADWPDLEASLMKIPSVKARKHHKEDGDAAARPRVVRGKDYAKIDRDDAGIRGKSVVAIVHAQGLIQGERNGTTVPFGMTMGAGTMEDVLRQAAADKKVKAIVLRVDSGGGESSTSWRIMQAAARAATAKPLVVSMNDIAASGAYMISYRCKPIVAERLSVVGSIGSISGKMNMRGFYDMLGITKDFVTRGPMATIDSDYYDYTPEEWASFTSRHMMDYQDWVSDIAAYRNMTPAEVDSIGRGRVWTGEQALERGLVDTLGTFTTAVELAKRMAKIPAGDGVRFEHYPKPEGLLSALREEGLAYAVNRLLRTLSIGSHPARTWAVDWNDYR